MRNKIEIFLKKSRKSLHGSAERRTFAPAKQETLLQARKQKRFLIGLT